MMVSALIEAEMAGRLFPVRNGVFVAIVGPSGAGKDTLIAYAAERLGEHDVHFVRRVVTRPADAGAEDHDTMSDEAFDAAEADGGFAVSWQAHGLKYGLPVAIDDMIRDGVVAVANVSRSALDTIRLRYASVLVIFVTARPDVLAERLAGRGRETKEEIVARLERQAASCDEIAGAVMLSNDGAPDVAGDRMIALIRRAMARAAVSETI